MKILANELRLNNWIEYSPAKGVGFELIQIKQLPFTDICTVKPIPLTEDILLKCGFELCRLSFSNRFTLNKITLFLIDNIFYVKLNGININIEYLHDLQNIYYYYNNKQELTVNL